MARQQKDFTYDANLLLKDAYLVAASAAAQVASANKIIDLGSGTAGAPTFPATGGRFDGRVIVDTTAVESDTGDELYTIIIQGSNSSTFANTIVDLGALLLGHTATTLESAVTPAVGRHELHFTNEKNGTLYRYLRLYTKVAGTIATGINYTALIAQQTGTV